MPPLLGQPNCYLPPPGCLPFAGPNKYLPPHNDIVTNAQTRSHLTIELPGPPPSVLPPLSTGLNNTSPLVTIQQRKFKNLIPIHTFLGNIGLPIDQSNFSLNTTISPLIDGWQLAVACVRACGIRAMLEVVVFVGLGCRRLVLSPPRARWLVDARCP